ncbi:MAG: hypothetical protein RIG68_17225 [Imperialibacter sp.]|uniref:hypothetical protein n=1 Tax=Imperialibacter sp. TaxID=2038411 RepID=UPI0032EFF39A
MKTLFASLLIIAGTTCYSKSGNDLEILNKFIRANNSGTEEAIGEFIKETYEPHLFEKIDLEKHIDFYMMISKNFGHLNTMVYKKIEENPLRLVVHLIKESESVLNKSIDPSEILVVEIDLNKDNPKYLSRGLGLGALVCELRKE